MNVEIVLVEIFPDATATVAQGIMTGLRICERGHLVRWPGFAEIARPARVPLYTHTEWLEGGRGLVVLDAHLHNSPSGRHVGVAKSAVLPHIRNMGAFPVWRTWGPHNPTVFTACDTARLTVLQLPSDSPLRESAGDVCQGVSARAVGFTPMYGDLLEFLERIAEVPTSECPYCMGAKYLAAHDGSAQPDVQQGHLKGWRVDEFKDVCPVVIGSPRMLNHQWHAGGLMSSAVILGDPRRMLVWGDGFYVSSPDHTPPASCSGGVWLFEHPLPHRDVD